MLEATECPLLSESLCHDALRYVLQSLQPLAEVLLRCLCVASALHQDIERIVVVVDSAPQVMALAMDGQRDLIERPFVPGPSPLALLPIGILLPTLETPLTDGFLGALDAAFAQEFLHVAVAQREAIREPDTRADDRAGDAVVLVAFRVSRRSHVGCLS